jgi:hypothetical protein
MSESIYRALKNLAARELKPNKTFVRGIINTATISYLIPIGLISVSLVILIINKKMEFELLNWIALIILFLGYLGVLMHPIVLIFHYKRSIYNFMNNPLSVIIDNTKRNHKLDEKYLKYFFSREKANLERTLIELKAEKDSFEKRTSILVGSIDKIGLFPGIVTLIMSISKINEKIELNWVTAIAYATPIIYLLGVYAHVLISTMNRHIELIKYVIENLNQKEKE